jgi:hypothetical protein
VVGNKSLTQKKQNAGLRASLSQGLPRASDGAGRCQW